MNNPVGELRSVAPGLLERLERVRGVEGIALGGSRARGTHQPNSDYDIGIYYDGLAVAELQALANEYCDAPVEFTEPGGWGPWVDGGAWLVIGGVHIDVIYRNLDRVAAVWTDCCDGRYVNAIQPGHPLGFWSHAYVGELSLCRPIGTWSAELSELREAACEYPEALAATLSAAIWESSFSIANARKAIPTADVMFAAGCLFRATGVMAQALHGHAKRWLINEKGAIASSAALPAAPQELEQRVANAFARIRPDDESLTAACNDLQALVDEAASMLSPGNPPTNEGDARSID